MRSDKGYGRSIDQVLRAERHCKLQIADCKLQIEPSRPATFRVHPMARSSDTFRIGTAQFAICNLQFAICNVLPP